MRRTGAVVLAVLIALAGTAAIVAFLQSRDESGIGAGGEGRAAPGVAAPEATDDRLRRGNVVLTYSEPADRAALQALAEDVAGPADPALVEAGVAILVERRPRQAQRVVATALRRRLEASGPADGELRRFAEFWLGRASME